MHQNLVRTAHQSLVVAQVHCRQGNPQLHVRLFSHAFLILTIVQFIVITKGAERVAEVAARFSLDAMPGKQMSIDADMRAGAIDMNEARRRRTRLEKESQLYGAMDGAVKFVKGDAIASIIIVFVNLGGGMLIGTMQRGMPASEAMAVYSILTIGDGLIAQIPALLISITAGMIVTRVTSEEGGRSNVGRDIAEQVMAQPNALLVAGAIMLGFALVPGMPGWVFMVLAVLAGVVGFVLLGRGLKGAAAPSDRTAGPIARAGAAGGPSSGEADAKTAASYAPTMPLVLDMATDLEHSLSARSLISALQHHETHHQIAARNEVSERLDDVPCIGLYQDQSGCRDGQRQAEQGGDQKNRRKGGERQWTGKVHRHHQQQCRHRDVDCHENIHQNRWQRQHQHEHHGHEDDREHQIGTAGGQRHESLQGCEGVFHGIG